MTESNVQPPTYSLREAAGRLGVSPRSVRRYVRSGQLEAVTVVGLHGPEYRVAEAALEAYSATAARDRVAMARPRSATPATATVDALVMVAAQLEAERASTREAWSRAEAAWSRIAELEAELAALRASPAPGRSWLDRLRGRVSAG